MKWERALKDCLGCRLSRYWFVENTTFSKKATEILKRMTLSLVVYKLRPSNTKVSSKIMSIGRHARKINKKYARIFHLRKFKSNCHKS